MHSKMLSAKWQPFCLVLNVLKHWPISCPLAPIANIGENAKQYTHRNCHDFSRPFWNSCLPAICLEWPYLLGCLILGQPHRMIQHLNTLRPRQNGRHFPDDTFKCIFLNENFRILSKISLKFVPKGPINKISALVQIMAWRRPGDKPLSEPMMVRLLTHICVTLPQWVNSLGPSDALRRWRSWSTLVQVMACCLTAPSHYLNQCWLIMISKVLWNSSQDIIIRRCQSVKQDWRLHF